MKVPLAISLNILSFSSSWPFGVICTFKAVIRVDSFAPIERMAPILDSLAVFDKIDAASIAGI